MGPQETKVYIAVLIGATVLGIVLVYFVVTMIRNQRRNQELYRSKILAEINTLEKERARIASDLHDEIGPVLLSAKYKINSIDIGNEEDKVTLEKTNKNIDDVINRMREISTDLLPAALLRKGLVVAITEFIENIGEPGGLKISFAHNDIPDLTNHKSVNIFRIVQEVVHNTIKHAKAGKLQIELTANDQFLFLRTNDDGKGFDYKQQSKNYSGLGLRNLLSRTEILGGNMYLDTLSGKGTSYTFEIPL